MFHGFKEIPARVVGSFHWLRTSRDVCKKNRAMISVVASLEFVWYV